MTYKEILKKIAPCGLNCEKCVEAYYKEEKDRPRYI